MLNFVAETAENSKHEISLLPIVVDADKLVTVKTYDKANSAFKQVTLRVVVATSQTVEASVLPISHGSKPFVRVSDSEKQQSLQYISTGG
jgi:hypothetical protein